MIAGGSGLKAGVVAYPTPMRCGNAFTSALVGLRRIVLAKVVPQFHPHHLGVKVKREDLEDVEENEFPPTYTRHAGKIRILFAERSKLSRMPRNWENLKSYLKEEFDSVAEFEETQGREHAREQVLRFYRADVVVDRKNEGFRCYCCYHEVMFVVVVVVVMVAVWTLILICNFRELVSQSFSDFRIFKKHTVRNVKQHDFSLLCSYHF